LTAAEAVPRGLIRLLLCKNTVSLRLHPVCRQR